MTSTFGDTLAVYCYGDVTSTPTVVFLHGGGTASGMRTDYLSRFLLGRGIPSLSFDHSGHGSSTGSLSASSLEKRAQEARDVLDQINAARPSALVGSSMGAHLAIHLARRLSLAKLVLFCPAVYNRNAFDKPFDHRFTEVIRQTDSFRDSDALDDLRDYSGEVHVCIGDRDEVIPKPVIDLIDRNASASSVKRIVFLEDCSHAVHATALEDDRIRAEIISFLERAVC